VLAPDPCRLASLRGEVFFQEIEILVRRYAKPNARHVRKITPSQDETVVGALLVSSKPNRARRLVGDYEAQ
jgi:hypothetical protein